MDSQTLKNQFVAMLYMSLKAIDLWAQSWLMKLEDSFPDAVEQLGESPPEWSNEYMRGFMEGYNSKSLENVVPYHIDK